MNCNLPDVTSSADCERTAARADAMQPSKWEVVKSALQTAIQRLPDTASVGITYFSNDDMCGVQSKPNVGIARLDEPQIKSLFASLDAVQPRGGTPIVGGMILAYKWLNPDQTPNQPHGKKIVVLLTDGEEGCAQDATDRLLQTEMPNAITARITTFVIGVPGSEVNRRLLSQMAFEGGAPSRPDCDHTSDDPTAGDCHYDMTKQTDLGAALNTALAAISGRALQCEFEVPQPTGGKKLDYGAVNVIYQAETNAAEQLIAQDAARACDDGANGWQYTADKSKIVLCGAACETVRRAASIRIVLGCESVVVE
jgi:von Willebrand factor type A domain-containing protein